MFSLAIWSALAAMGASSTIATSGLGKEDLFPVPALETRRRDATDLRSNDMRTLRSDLVAARAQQRESPELFKTNGSLDLGWNDAELFSYGFLSVICATCYIKGTATASLVVEDDFNITTAFGGFVEAFGSELKNITVEVWDQFTAWAEFVAENVTDTIGQDLVNAFQGDFGAMQGIDFDDYEFPTIDMDFNVNLTDMPEAKIKLEFDGLELYMSLNVSLDAGQAYTIPLYPKEWFQPAGIVVGGQEIGIVIALDLLLEVDAQANISSGIHIAFDDGLAVELAMFGHDVSTITLTDGSFEFLPVTLSTSGLVLDATLRLGVTAGLNMSADLADLVDLGAGASAQVYADLARFRTNVTAADATAAELKKRGDTGYADDCARPVVETYEFGLGAQAGVFVEFAHDTWGPTPETSVQIFYTTLYSACAVVVSSSSTTSTTTSGALGGVVVPTATTTPPLSAAASKRTEEASMTWGSATSVYTVTNVLCQDPGRRNCPASLQRTTHAVRTSTVYASVPAGAAVPFPATATTGLGAAGGAARTFGAGANQVTASSGRPVSYVPPPPPTSTASDGAAGGGVGEGLLSDRGNMTLVVGLSVGLGSVLLTAVAASLWWYCRRRNSPAGGSSSGSPTTTTNLGTAGPYHEVSSDASLRPFLLDVPTPTTPRKLRWKTSADSVLTTTTSSQSLGEVYESPRLGTVATATTTTRKY